MARQQDFILNFKKKVAKSYETMSVSYHEAGHAICALLHFLKVNWISIQENNHLQQMEGITTYSSYLENTEDIDLFTYYLNSEIYVFYSGLVAEKLLYKKITGSDKYPSFLKDGASYDTQNAAKLITKYHSYTAGEQRFKYKKRVTKEISDLLESHWGDIELVSHLLFRKKRINYEQIKNLLINKSEYKYFWKKQFKSIDILTTIFPPSLDIEKIKIIIGL